MNLAKRSAAKAKDPVHLSTCYLKFLVEKKSFFSASFKQESCQSSIHQIKDVGPFFFPSYGQAHKWEEHFASGMSMQLPGRGFSRKAPGSRLWLMRSELTWPEEAACEKQASVYHRISSRARLRDTPTGNTSLRTPITSATNVLQWLIRKSWVNNESLICKYIFRAQTISSMLDRLVSLSLS